MHVFSVYQYLFCWQNDLFALNCRLMESPSDPPIILVTKVHAVHEQSFYAHERAVHEHWNVQSSVTHHDTLRVFLYWGEVIRFINYAIWKNSNSSKRIFIRAENVAFREITDALTQIRSVLFFWFENKSNKQRTKRIINYYPRGGGDYGSQQCA